MRLQADRVSVGLWMEAIQVSEGWGLRSGCVGVSVGFGATGGPGEC